MTRSRRRRACAGRYINPPSGRVCGLAPPRPGPGGDVQRGPSPVGGGHAGHLEMAHSLIFTRLPESISNRHAENAKRPGKPPFPDFQCHFHEHEGRLDCWTSRAARSRVEASSDEAPAVVSHPVEPTLPLRFARRIDHSQQGFVDGRHAGEAIVTTSRADRPASSPVGGRGCGAQGHFPLDHWTGRTPPDDTDHPSLGLVCRSGSQARQSVELKGWQQLFMCEGHGGVLSSYLTNGSSTYVLRNGRIHPQSTPREENA